MKKRDIRKLIISCDGGAASGKTTGAKMISKKYNLKFLSSGMLYRYASYLILKNKPKNENQVVELLDDISKDLFNHDLELRIQELESKFSEDLSETTFNQLKELKNERKIN